MSFLEIQLKQRFKLLLKRMQELAIQLETPGEHDHDSRYYTESEMDTKLMAKADDNHLHDDRYYTEGEVDSALAGQTHTEAQITDLVHDATKVQGVTVDDTDKANAKVLAYNSTSGNLEYETIQPGWNYQRLNTSAISLTCDGSYKNLDLSSYITHDHPRLILVSVYFTCNTVGDMAKVRRYGDSGYNEWQINCLVVNQYHFLNVAVAMTDDKYISYMCFKTGTMTAYMKLMGYFYEE